MMRSRRLTLSILIGVIILIIVTGTWHVARTVQSPAQRDAAAAPPSLSPITVPVQRGTLRDQITATATLDADSTTTVTIPLSGGANVVTHTTLSPGDTLHYGQSILRIDGRPLIALPGLFPSYRELHEGDEGDDVDQLQQALVTLGYRLTIDGQFGPATAQAVTDLYRSVGFTPLTTIRHHPDTTTSNPSSTQADSAESRHPSTPQDLPQKNTEPIITIPHNELLYVPQGYENSTIAEIPEVGSILHDTSATLTLSSGPDAIRADVPQSTADGLSLGSTASAFINNEEYLFTLESITPPEKSSQDTADQEVSPGAASPVTVGGALAVNSSYALNFSADRPLADELRHGDSLVLTINRTPPIIEALLIPKRALSSSPSGQHTVLRQDPSGQFTTVTVDLLGCVGGQCAVADDALNEGDLLRVDGS